MKTWVLLMMAGLALSGCTGPADVQSADGSEADGPDTVEAVTNATTAPAIHTWEGSITGVGADLPSTGPLLAGSFSTEGSFRVAANATRMILDVTPTGGASTDLFVRIWDPSEEGTTYGNLPDALPLDPIHVEIDSPEKGKWEAMVFVEGAAAGQSYEVTVTVEYE